MDVDGCSAILLSIHAMAAAYFSVAELQLDPEESTRIASALAKVAAQYDVRLTGKAVAWTQLCTVIAGVYGPRIAAYGIRTASERKQRAVKAKVAATTIPPATLPPGLDGEMPPNPYTNFQSVNGNVN